jgi:hypothetical protein
MGFRRIKINSSFNFQDRLEIFKWDTFTLSMILPFQNLQPSLKIDGVIDFYTAPIFRDKTNFLTQRCFYLKISLTQVAISYIFWNLMTYTLILTYLLITENAYLCIYNPNCLTKWVFWDVCGKQQLLQIWL